MNKKRIIIELAGGLGNQMFQYAFYLKMQSLGYDCQLYFDQANTIHNGPELNKAFGIELAFVPASTIEALLDRRQTFFRKLKRKISGSSPSFYWEHDKGYEFKPEIFDQEKPVYLQGCWLSQKYFSDIASKVREAFTFGKPDNSNAKALENISGQPNSISIHIRKGDYQSSNIHLKLDYGAYLEEAMAYFNNSEEEPVFYVFSDDIAAARETLETYRNEKEIHFVDWNKGERSFWDMFLMSHCRHNIISNSTFSWWAAWLNTHNDKIIISPKDWFTVKEWNKNSIVPPGWITL